MMRVVRASIRDLNEYEEVEIPEDRMGVRDAIDSFADYEGETACLNALLNWFDTDQLRDFIEHVYDIRDWQYVKNSNRINKKTSVNASIVSLEDGEDYSSDVSSDVARDVLYECADVFGAASVLDYVLKYFSTWDLKPVADDFLNDNSMKYEE